MSVLVYVFLVSMCLHFWGYTPTSETAGSKGMFIFSFSGY